MQLCELFPTNIERTWTQRTKKEYNVGPSHNVVIIEHFLLKYGKILFLGFGKSLLYEYESSL